MSISSTARRAGPFFGNGVATDFSFDFKLFKPEELRVVRLDGPTGLEVDLVEGVDYDAALNLDQDENPGGGVTLRAPLAVGDRLTLVSAVPELQPVDITNQGGFYPDLLNGGLDRATILVQQLKDESDRTIKLPVSSTQTDLTLPLPQGNQLLTWNGDGSALVNRDPGELISVVTYGNTRADIFDGDGTQTIFALSASPGSVNNLQIAINGVMQVPGVDYSWGGNTALSFTSAPPAGTKVFVRYQEALDEGTDVSGKANKTGDNINPATEAPLFRENIEAAPEKVATYNDGAPVDPDIQLRPVAEKLLDIVNAQDGFEFETVRNTDAKASLEALFAKRREDGGDVILSPGMVRVSSLHIPAGVTVRGSSNRPGEEKGTRDYTRLGTIIWLDPAGTITLEDLASLENVTILNPNLRYIKVIDGVPDAAEAQAMGTAIYTTGPFAGRYAGVAQFSGTAITINGDDTSVRDCLVIGFETAYKSTTYVDPPPTMPPGPSRQNVSGLWGDCTNGIDVSDCWDVARFDKCHFWNFFTAHTGYTWAAVKRSGVAYHFHDHVDGMMMTNCFTLGWTNSYKFKDTYAAVITGCTGDGLVDGSMSDPNSIGFLTEGYAAGMQLNGVRCDGNKRNFVFNHTQGIVTGEIIGGITADGTNVEFAAGSNGATLDIAALGDANFPVFIGTGAQNVTIRSLTCFYIGADTSELITLQDPADIKSVYIGPVNLEDGGFGYHTRGFRVRDKIIAGGRQDVVTELRGAPTGTPAAVAAMSETEASIDIEACGSLPDTSRVNIVRRTLAGVRQRLASFDAENIVPAEWLFRSRTINTLNMIAAGAEASISFVFEPKGTGQVIAFSDLVGGANRANSVTISGDDDMTPGPMVQANGAAANISLTIASKGAGGINLAAPVFADDAAAATGGIPVGMGYITSDGYYKKRVA